MKGNLLLLPALFFFSFTDVMAEATPSPIFYCTTDEGDTVSLTDNGSKLELKINNDEYISDEKSGKLKGEYIKQTNKIDEYKIINFHSGDNDIDVGTSRTTPDQDLPSSGVSFFNKESKKTTYYPCTPGEDENNFDEWKKGV